MRWLPAVLLLSACATAPSHTYKLDDGLSYYKAPLVKLDGSVSSLDIEVGELTYLFCSESRFDETMLQMACIVETPDHMSTVQTFLYGAPP